MPPAARAAPRRPAARSHRTRFHKIALLIVFSSLAWLEATRDGEPSAVRFDRSAPARPNPLSIATPEIHAGGTWW